MAGCGAVTPAVPDWRKHPDEPYPFTTPVPPPIATAIDGSYDRDPTDDYEGEWAHCVRCPPYFVDRGRSTLEFASGRWQNAHQQPRQLTIGHFTVAGDRVVFFNDPLCPHDRGEYRFSLEGGLLLFEVVDDACAFGQRERDLTDLTWQRLVGGD